MKTSTLALFCAFAFALQCTLATKPKRTPKPLRRINTKFLNGGFFVGLTTKKSPKCQITFLKPGAGKKLMQTAAIVDDNGMARPPFPRPNVFTQVGRKGLFKLGPFELFIIKRGPVLKGRYLFIVLFEPSTGKFTVEISNLFIFNKFFKRRTARFIKSFGVKKLNNLARDRRCLRMLPRRFQFPAAPMPMPKPMPMRKPTPLRRLNPKFLNGGFFVGLTTKTSPKCQITFLKPGKGDKIIQTAAIVDDMGVVRPPPARPNVFTQIGGKGLFKIGTFELFIIKTGPVVRGAYVFIVLFEPGSGLFTVEISNLYIFNKFFKRRTARFIKSFGVNKLNNLARDRRCLRKLPRDFMFPAM